jgi:RNA polymerase sigma-70 factor (ECF subfamily)
MDDVRSLAVRGDGSPKRIRNRPHPNETPTRHSPPGSNAKPLGGRVATPARPAMPTQPGPVQAPPEGGDQPGGTDAETAVIPVVPAQEGSRSGGGDGFPSRPDPSDPANVVWSLVERAQAGEAEAFGLIYDRYVDTVFRFVYFRVGNRQLAEDLTSDTFLRALKRIGSFTWQGRDLGAWLVTIARNLVADHFKSGRYRLEVTTGDVLDAEREDRGPEGSPEAAVVEHITNVALLTAVKQLNPEQQECIVLRFLQGFSVAETAQAMGKNEGAIKALQYRAVRALARLLPDGFQP